MNEEDYTNISARLTLNARLTTLSIWAQDRADGEFNHHTTLTMLKRRVEDIEDAVSKSKCEAYGTYNIYKSNQL